LKLSSHPDSTNDRSGLNIKTWTCIFCGSHRTKKTSNHCITATVRWYEQDLSVVYVHYYYCNVKWFESEAPNIQPENSPITIAITPKLFG